MPADALRIRGRHNAANALAALALATAIGCPLAPMLHGLREYRGEPHRVEFVASVGGVEAFDDSKGTNVGATVAALDGLGADKAPAKLVVILGGDGKGQDFAPLAAPVARHARAVALIGRDAAAIEAALAAIGVPLQRHDTLEAATRWCFAQAREGDAVLLSPACASLDMFRNYAPPRRGVRRRGAGAGGRARGSGVIADRCVRRRLQALRRRSARARPSRATVPIRDWARSTRGAAGAAARLRPAAGVGRGRAARAVGLVMVYSASVALPDNPKFARYAPTHFLTRHAARPSPSARSRRWSRCRSRSATWEKWAPWLFVASLVLLALVLIRASARASTARAAGFRSAC